MLNKHKTYSLQHYKLPIYFILSHPKNELSTKETV